MGSATALVNRRRTPALAAAFALIVVLLSACTPTGGDARSAAESVIAYQVVQLEERLGGLQVEGELPTARELRDADVAPYIAIEPTQQTTLREEMNADVTVYEITSEGGSVHISVYVPADGNGGSGFAGRRKSVYSCGVIRFQPGENGTDLRDMTCPDWLRDWRGDKAQEVSMVGAVDQYRERWRD